MHWHFYLGYKSVRFTPMSNDLLFSKSTCLRELNLQDLNKQNFSVYIINYDWVYLFVNDFGRSGNEFPQFYDRWLAYVIHCLREIERHEDDIVCVFYESAFR